MNTWSRNRSPFTPSDLYEMQPFSHGRLTSSLLLWTLGPSLLQPPFLLLFGLNVFLSFPVSVQLLWFFSSPACPLYLPLQLRFPVVQDSAAPTLPLSFGLLLVSDELASFFSPFSSLAPSLPASTLPLSSSSHCRKLILLFFVLHHLSRIVFSFYFTCFTSSVQY